MRVLFVTSECYPVVKTGGLADVSAALPPALNDLGLDARVLLPGYPAVLDGLEDKRTLRPLSGLPGVGEGALIAGRLPGGVTAYAIDAPALYARPGNPYVSPSGLGWADNHLRFAALGWVAAGFAGPAVDDRQWRPDLIHGNDWQSGLMPAYVAFMGSRRPATVMTIHNIAYQGQFAETSLGALHLPPHCYHMHGVEYYGTIGFLKAGLYYADRLTTVSPTYAREIQSAEHGCGLEGLLASRTEELTGILNGVDYGIWNPASDPYLVAPYDHAGLEVKARSKAALQAEFGLDVNPEAPLFAMVSRLNWHKGADLLPEVLPALFARGGQVVLLGTGEAGLETALSAIGAARPRSAGVHIGYDEAQAHRIQAGADVLMVPSRAEPCGLTQLYAMRYGTLPLVRRTGGLEDTVIDATPAALADGCATGFAFDEATAEALGWAIRRAADLYRAPERWRALQQRAMTRDFGWAGSAREYLRLYRELVPGR
ncbi:MAG: glycogen synthase GlgA [Rhodospirillaceae bacterium]